MGQGHGPNGLLDQHDPIGSRHRIRGTHRHFQLSGPVLGMELLDRHSLAREGRHHIAPVIRQFDHAGHAIGRTHAGRHDLLPLVAPDEPFHLEGHLKRESFLGRFGSHSGDEVALASGVGIALLCPPVGGGPGPTGLGDELRQAVKVGKQPQVTHRAADPGRGGYGIVDDEDIEDWRHPDSPGLRIDEPSDRYRLDPGDAGVVHPRHSDSLNPATGHLLGQALGPFSVIRALHRHQSASRGMDGSEGEAVTSPACQQEHERRSPLSEGPMPNWPRSSPHPISTPSWRSPDRRSGPWPTCSAISAARRRSDGTR